MEDNFLLGVANLKNDINISTSLINSNNPTSSTDMILNTASSTDLTSSSDIVDTTNATNISKNLFILLKMRSVQDVFPSIHAWEDKMFYDLHGFFGIDITPNTNYLLTKDFEDGIVQNKNARILRDNDGKIVMMYVYVNGTSLVITNSETTTNEIITRLSASQIKK